MLRKFKVNAYSNTLLNLSHLDGLAEDTTSDAGELPEYAVATEAQGEMGNMEIEPTIIPPRYSSLLGPMRILNKNPSHLQPLDTPIPGPSRPFIHLAEEYRYDITAGHGSRPWATLKVTSNESGSSMAKVRGGRNITGSVEIDLETPRTIHFITLTLRGVIMTTSLRDDSYTFMNHITTIWTYGVGHPSPTLPSPSVGYSHPERRITPFVTSSPSTSPISDKLPYLSPSLSTNITHSDLPTSAKLLNPEYIITPFILPSSFTQAANDKTTALPPPSPIDTDITPITPGKSRDFLGQYRWPFSFPFPTEMDVSGDKSGRPAIWTSAPPSIRGHGVNVTIRYHLTLKISHGKFRMVSRVEAPIIYIPKIEPEAVSPLCRAAYLAEEAPPSPLVDSLGWKDLPKVSIRGQVFRHRALDVACTLSLANPQCYTRGTSIPCFLTTSSRDFEALDSLVPKQVHVRLKRYIRYFKKPAFQMHMGDKDMIEYSQDISRAVWSSTESNSQDRYTRRIQGEIHLDPRLLPSCSTRFFSLRYTVELLPFNSELFQGENGPNEVLLAHEVSVATQLGKGPPPVALTASNKSGDTTTKPGWTYDRVQDLRELYSSTLDL